MNCYIFSFIIALFSILLVQSHTYQPTLVLVDGFTEYLSGYCRQYCNDHDIKLIELVSPYICNIFKSKGNEVPEKLKAPIETNDIINWAIDNELITSIEDFHEHLCILSESDSGVSTAEKIAHVLNCRGNGLSPQLRNKYESNIRCQQYGLQTVKQQLVSNVDEAVSFAKGLWGIDSTDSDINLNPNEIVNKVRKCVVKPYRGVASDGVFLCQSYEDIDRAVSSLINQPKYGGGINEAVVIQEFADGQEYAVDTVALDGEIKVVALWKYHKLAANNAPFVYQCTELIPADGEIEKEVCDYCINVLKAQGLKWGPTHTEIKYTSNGPRLIEINARWHAQHFPPITKACLGNDAVTLTLDSYFNQGNFYDLPVYPEKLNGYGRILHLISYFSGKVKSINHINEIKQLNSTVLVNIESNVDDNIVKTVDIRTDCGYVLLYNNNKTILENDYNYITDLQASLFAIYENEQEEKDELIHEIDLINQSYIQGDLSPSLDNKFDQNKIIAILKRSLVILVGSYIISNLIVQIIPLFDDLIIK